MNILNNIDFDLVSGGDKCECYGKPMTKRPDGVIVIGGLELIHTIDIGGSRVTARDCINECKEAQGKINKRNPGTVAITNYRLTTDEGVLTGKV